MDEDSDYPYLTNAETELGITKGIISDGFKNLTSNSDCEKIKQIFGTIDSVNQNNYREYFDNAVYLLEQMVLSSGKTSGEYLTNLSLAKLIGKLLDCKPGMSLYDGFCGYGVLTDKQIEENPEYYCSPN